MEGNNHPLIVGIVARQPDIPIGRMTVSLEPKRLALLVDGDVEAFAETSRHDLHGKMRELGGRSRIRVVGDGLRHFRRPRIGSPLFDLTQQGTVVLRGRDQVGRPQTVVEPHLAEISSQSTVAKRGLPAVAMRAAQLGQIPPGIGGTLGIVARGGVPQLQLSLRKRRAAPGRRRFSVASCGSSRRIAVARKPGRTERRPPVRWCVPGPVECVDRPAVVPRGNTREEVLEVGGELSIKSDNPPRSAFHFNLMGQLQSSQLEERVQAEHPLSLARDRRPHRP